MRKPRRISSVIIFLGLFACEGGKGTATEADLPAPTTGDGTASDGPGVSSSGGDHAASGAMTTAATVTGDLPEMMTTNATTLEEPDTTTTGEPVQPCAGEPVPIEAEIIAYTESQAKDTGDSEDGTTGDDGDPTLLYVRFSDLAFTCEDPHDRLACGEHWELSLRIPTAFQAPGLYELSFDGVHGFGQSTGHDLGGDDCDGGGGSAKGTLEILSIDEQSVTGRLCHVTSFTLDGDIELDGSFVAPRCPL